MNSKISLMLAIILVSSLIVACPAPAPPPPPPPPPVVAPDPLKEEIKPMSLSIATGGVGGIYYPYGGGVAEIINKHIPGLKATAEVTAASVANLRMINRGEAHLGLTMDDVLWEAWYGRGRFAAEGALLNLRALFQTYPSYFYVVTLKEYPIHKFADLKGKRWSVGAPGSGTEIMTMNVISALGMKPEDYKISRLGFAENVTALRDKTIDAGSWVAGLPVSSIIDIATTHDIRIIPFSPEEQKRIMDAFPFYSPVTIPKGSYRGIDVDVPTLGIGNTFVAHKDIQYRAAYEIVKAVFENLDHLRKVHAVARDTVLERAAMVPIPLHPGAERYYKEKGVLR